MRCYLGKKYEKTSFSKDIFIARLKKIPTPAPLDKAFAYSSLVCCNYDRGRGIFKLQEREISGG